MGKLGPVAGYLKDLGFSTLQVDAVLSANSIQPSLVPKQLEAVKAFQDLQAHWLVPMHYGTFKLSFEDMDEPPRWLRQLAQENGISSKVRILDEGIPTVF